MYTGCRNFEPTSNIAGGMDSHLFAGFSTFHVDGRAARHDDDLVDRLSHVFTALLLLLFTLAISTRQFIGKPIACWVPTEFTRAQEEYAESVCWATSTYFLPTRLRTVPVDLGEREDGRLGYYQWVPFVLMIQAFLFNLPCLVWRLFNWQSGVQLASIMEVACDIHTIKDPSSRRSTVAYLARYIQDTLLLPLPHFSRSCAGRCRRWITRCCCLWPGPRHCGSYLLSLYLFVKWLYIVNTAGQFYVMNRYLGGGNYTLYGLELLQDVARGRAWQESGHFPRITLCDFEIRRLGNIHRHTVQCVLPINMFNEKIYIFLWFWFILMFIATTSSFFVWFGRSVLPHARLRFVRKFLKLRDVFTPGDRRRCACFVNSFLRADGIFILRLIEHNAGHLITAEVVERLWLCYKRRSYHEAATGNSQWDEASVTLATTASATVEMMSTETQPTRAPLSCSDRPPRYPSSSSAVRRSRKRMPLNEKDDPGEFV